MRMATCSESKHVWPKDDNLRVESSQPKRYLNIPQMHSFLDLSSITQVKSKLKSCPDQTGPPCKKSPAKGCMDDDCNMTHKKTNSGRLGRLLPFLKQTVRSCLIVIKNNVRIKAMFESCIAWHQHERWLNRCSSLLFSEMSLLLLEDVNLLPLLHRERRLDALLSFCLFIGSGGRLVQALLVGHQLLVEQLVLLS